MYFLIISTLEEMDDRSLNKDDLTLDHVFITDEEKDLAEKLDASLNKDGIARHVQLVLDKMNTRMRTIFQLFANEGFTLNEIANIRDAKLSEVEKDLNEARKILRNSIEKRFLIDSN